MSHGNLELQIDDDDLRAFYIDKSGQIAFDGYFGACGDFAEGLAPVQVDGRWVYIDRSGKIRLQTNFGSEVQASPFSDGLAAINFAGKAKFINLRGEVEFETEYDWADDFNEGIARVKNVASNGSESIGYIDQKGRVIWKPSQ